MPPGPWPPPASELPTYTADRPRALSPRPWLIFRCSFPLDDGDLWGATAAAPSTKFAPDGIWHGAIPLGPGELVHLHLRSGRSASAEGNYSCTSVYLNTNFPPSYTADTHWYGYLFI